MNDELKGQLLKALWLVKEGHNFDDAFDDYGNMVDAIINVAYLAYGKEYVDTWNPGKMNNAQIFKALMDGERIKDALGNEWYLSTDGNIASTKSTELDDLFYGITCEIMEKQNVK